MLNKAKEIANGMLIFAKYQSHIFTQTIGFIQYIGVSFESNLSEDECQILKENHWYYQNKIWNYNL